MAAVLALRNPGRFVSFNFRPNKSNLCSSIFSYTASNFSTDSSHQNPPNAVQVPPPPSWSVSELRLSSADDTKQDKISEEELATLARRCLIDVRRLTPERRDQLRVDIAGIMRCASVLLDCDSKESTLTDQEVYDNPRGLGRMPVRRNESNDGQSEWLHGSKESMAVMEIDSVKSRIVVDDGEGYFSAVTKR